MSGRGLLNLGRAVPVAEVEDARCKPETQRKQATSSLNAVPFLSENMNMLITMKISYRKLGFILISTGLAPDPSLAGGALQAQHACAHLTE